MKRTTAPNSVGGLHVDKVAGVTIGTTGIAEDRNNLQEEIANAIEGSGAVLDGGDDEQLKAAIISLSHGVGEPVFSVIKRAAAVTWPAVRIDDGDHDIAAANWPDLVAALRAEKMESDGVTDHAAVPVAAGVATFPNTNTCNRLIAALAEEELVHGGYANWLSLNLGGTDYAITNVNAGARTITVAAPPGNGNYTAIVYPYRVAGAATARLRRISARALVGSQQEAADAPDRMQLAGARMRDRFESHQHSHWGGNAGALTMSQLIVSQSRGAEQTSTVGEVGAPIGDGTNVLRTGATTDPRTFAGYLYIWAGRYAP